MLTVTCDICGVEIKNAIERIDLVFETPCINHISERHNLCPSCANKVKKFIKTEGEKICQK